MGDVSRLKLVPPLHMPRLDWRLWLLAQGRPASDWYDALLQRLADGSADVLGLLEPPRDETRLPQPWLAVRGRLYEYRYSRGGDGEGGVEGGRSADRWVRSPAGKRVDGLFGEVAWRKKGD